MASSRKSAPDSIQSTSTSSKFRHAVAKSVKSKAKSKSGHKKKKTASAGKKLTRDSKKEPKNTPSRDSVKGTAEKPITNPSFTTKTTTTKYESANFPLDLSDCLQDASVWEAMEIRFLENDTCTVLRPKLCASASTGEDKSQKTSVLDGAGLVAKNGDLTKSKGQIRRQTVCVEKVHVKNLLNTKREKCGNLSSSRLSEYRPPNVYSAMDTCTNAEVKMGYRAVGEYRSEEYFTDTETFETVYESDKPSLIFGRTSDSKSAADTRSTTNDMRSTVNETHSEFNKSRGRHNEISQPSRGERQTGKVEVAVQSCFLSDEDSDVDERNTGDECCCSMRRESQLQLSEAKSRGGQRRKAKETCYRAKSSYIKHHPTVVVKKSASVSGQQSQSFSFKKPNVDYQAQLKWPNVECKVFVKETSTDNTKASSTEYLKESSAEFTRDSSAEFAEESSAELCIGSSAEIATGSSAEREDSSAGSERDSSVESTIVTKRLPPDKEDFKNIFLSNYKSPTTYTRDVSKNWEISSRHSSAMSSNSMKNCSRQNNITSTSTNVKCHPGSQPDPYSDDYRDLSHRKNTADIRMKKDTGDDVSQSEESKLKRSESNQTAGTTESTTGSGSDWSKRSESQEAEKCSRKSDMPKDCGPTFSPLSEAEIARYKQIALQILIQRKKGEAYKAMSKRSDDCSTASISKKKHTSTRKRFSRPETKSDLRSEGMKSETKSSKTDKSDGLQQESLETTRANSYDHNVVSASRRIRNQIEKHKKRLQQAKEIAHEKEKSEGEPQTKTKKKKQPKNSVLHNKADKSEVFQTVRTPKHRITITKDTVSAITSDTSSVLSWNPGFAGCISPGQKIAVTSQTMGHSRADEAKSGRTVKSNTTTTLSTTKSDLQCVKSSDDVTHASSRAADAAMEAAQFKAGAMSDFRRDEVDDQDRLVPICHSVNRAILSSELSGKKETNPNFKSSGVLTRPLQSTDIPKDHNYVKDLGIQANMGQDEFLATLKDDDTRSTQGSLIAKRPLKYFELLQNILKSPTARATQALGMFLQKPDALASAERELDITVDQIINSYQEIFDELNTITGQASKAPHTQAQVDTQAKLNNQAKMDTQQRSRRDPDQPRDLTDGDVEEHRRSNSALSGKKMKTPSPALAGCEFGEKKVELSPKVLPSLSGRQVGDTINKSGESAKYLTFDTTKAAIAEDTKMIKPPTKPSKFEASLPTKISCKTARQHFCSLMGESSMGKKDLPRYQLPTKSSNSKVLMSLSSSSVHQKKNSESTERNGRLAWSTKNSRSKMKKTDGAGVSQAGIQRKMTRASSLSATRMVNTKNSDGHSLSKPPIGVTAVTGTDRSPGGCNISPRHSPILKPSKEMPPKASQPYRIARKETSPGSPKPPTDNNMHKLFQGIQQRFQPFRLGRSGMRRAHSGITIAAPPLSLNISPVTAGIQGPIAGLDDSQTNSDEAEKLNTVKKSLSDLLLIKQSSVGVSTTERRKGFQTENKGVTSAPKLEDFVVKQECSSSLSAVNAAQRPSKTEQHKDKAGVKSDGMGTKVTKLTKRTSSSIRRPLLLPLSKKHIAPENKAVLVESDLLIAHAAAYEQRVNLEIKKPEFVKPTTGARSTIQHQRNPRMRDCSTERLESSFEGQSQNEKHPSGTENNKAIMDIIPSDKQPHRLNLFSTVHKPALTGSSAVKEAAIRSRNGQTVGSLSEPVLYKVHKAPSNNKPIPGQHSTVSSMNKRSPSLALKRSPHRLNTSTTQSSSVRKAISSNPIHTQAKKCLSASDMISANNFLKTPAAAKAVSKTDWRPPQRRSGDRTASRSGKKSQSEKSLIPPNAKESDAISASGSWSRLHMIRRWGSSFTTTVTRAPRLATEARSRKAAIDPKNTLKRRSRSDECVLSAKNRSWLLKKRNIETLDAAPPILISLSSSPELSDKDDTESRYGTVCNNVTFDLKGLRPDLTLDDIVRQNKDASHLNENDGAQPGTEGSKTKRPTTPPRPTRSPPVLLKTAQNNRLSLDGHSYKPTGPEQMILKKIQATYGKKQHASDEESETSDLLSFQTLRKRAVAKTCEMIINESKNLTGSKDAPSCLDPVGSESILELSSPEKTNSPEKPVDGKTLASKDPLKSPESRTIGARGSKAVVTPSDTSHVISLGPVPKQRTTLVYVLDQNSKGVAPDVGLETVLPQTRNDHSATSISASHIKTSPNSTDLTTGEPINNKATSAPGAAKVTSPPSDGVMRSPKRRGHGFKGTEKSGIDQIAMCVAISEQSLSPDHKFKGEFSQHTFPRYQDDKQFYLEDADYLQMPLSRSTLRPDALKISPAIVMPVHEVLKSPPHIALVNATAVRHKSFFPDKTSTWECAEIEMNAQTTLMSKELLCMVNVEVSETNSNERGFHEYALAPETVTRVHSKRSHFDQMNDDVGDPHHRRNVAHDDSVVKSEKFVAHFHNKNGTNDELEGSENKRVSCSERAPDYISSNRQHEQESSCTTETSPYSDIFKISQRARDGLISADTCREFVTMVKVDSDKMMGSGSPPLRRPHLQDFNIHRPKPMDKHFYQGGDRTKQAIAREWPTMHEPAHETRLHVSEDVYQIFLCGESTDEQSSGVELKHGECYNTTSLEPTSTKNHDESGQIATGEMTTRAPDRKQANYTETESTQTPNVQEAGQQHRETLEGSKENIRADDNNEPSGQLIASRSYSEIIITPNQIQTNCVTVSSKETIKSEAFKSSQLDSLNTKADFVSIWSELKTDKADSRILDNTDGQSNGLALSQNIETDCLNKISPSGHGTQAREIADVRPGSIQTLNNHEMIPSQNTKLGEDEEKQKHFEEPSNNDRCSVGGGNSGNRLVADHTDPPPNTRPSVGALFGGYTTSMAASENKEFGQKQELGMRIHIALEEIVGCQWKPFSGQASTYNVAVDNLICGRVDAVHLNANLVTMSQPGVVHDSETSGKKETDEQLTGEKVGMENCSVKDYSCSKDSVACSKVAAVGPGEDRQGNEQTHLITNERASVKLQQGDGIYDKSESGILNSKINLPKTALGARLRSLSMDDCGAIVVSRSNNRGIVKSDGYFDCLRIKPEVCISVGIQTEVRQTKAACHCRDGKPVRDILVESQSFMLTEENLKGSTNVTDEVTNQSIVKLGQGEKVNDADQPVEDNNRDARVVGTEDTHSRKPDSQSCTSMDVPRKNECTDLDGLIMKNIEKMKAKIINTAKRTSPPENNASLDQEEVKRVSEVIANNEGITLEDSENPRLNIHRQSMPRAVPANCDQLSPCSEDEVERDPSVPRAPSTDAGTNVNSSGSASPPLSDEEPHILAVGRPVRVLTRSGPINYRYIQQKALENLESFLKTAIASKWRGNTLKSPPKVKSRLDNARTHRSCPAGTTKTPAPPALIPGSELGVSANSYLTLSYLREAHAGRPSSLLHDETPDDNDLITCYDLSPLLFGKMDEEEDMIGPHTQFSLINIQQESKDVPSEQVFEHTPPCGVPDPTEDMLYSDTIKQIPCPLPKTTSKIFFNDALVSRGRGLEDSAQNIKQGDILEQGKHTDTMALLKHIDPNTNKNPIVKAPLSQSDFCEIFTSRYPEDGRNKAISSHPVGLTTNLQHQFGQNKNLTQRTSMCSSPLSQFNVPSQLTHSYPSATSKPNGCQATVRFASRNSYSEVGPQVFKNNNPFATDAINNPFLTTFETLLTSSPSESENTALPAHPPSASRGTHSQQRNPANPICSHSTVYNPVDKPLVDVTEIPETSETSQKPTRFVLTSEELKSFFGSDSVHSSDSSDKNDSSQKTQYRSLNTTKEQLILFSDDPFACTQKLTDGSLLQTHPSTASSTSDKLLNDSDVQLSQLERETENVSGQGCQRTELLIPFNQIKPEHLPSLESTKSSQSCLGRCGKLSGHYTLLDTRDEHGWGSNFEMTMSPFENSSESVNYASLSVSTGSEKPLGTICSNIDLSSMETFSVTKPPGVNSSKISLIETTSSATSFSQDETDFSSWTLDDQSNLSFCSQAPLLPKFGRPLHKVKSTVKPTPVASKTMSSTDCESEDSENNNHSYSEYVDQDFLDSVTLLTSRFLSVFLGIETEVKRKYAGKKKEMKPKKLCKQRRCAANIYRRHGQTSQGPRHSNQEGGHWDKKFSSLKFKRRRKGQLNQKGNLNSDSFNTVSSSPVSRESLSVTDLVVDERKKAAPVDDSEKTYRTCSDVLVSMDAHSPGTDTLLEHESEESASGPNPQYESVRKGSSWNDVHFGSMNYLNQMLMDRTLTHLPCCHHRSPPCRRMFVDIDSDGNVIDDYFFSTPDDPPELIPGVFMYNSQLAEGHLYPGLNSFIHTVYEDDVADCLLDSDVNNLFNQPPIMAETVIGQTEPGHGIPVVHDCSYSLRLGNEFPLEMYPCAIPNLSGKTTWFSSPPLLQTLFIILGEDETGDNLDLPKNDVDDLETGIQEAWSCQNTKDATGIQGAWSCQNTKDASDQMQVIQTKGARALEQEKIIKQWEEKLAECLTEKGNDDAGEREARTTSSSEARDVVYQTKIYEQDYDGEIHEVVFFTKGQSTAEEPKPTPQVNCRVGCQTRKRKFSPRNGADENCGRFFHYRVIKDDDQVPPLKRKKLGPSKQHLETHHSNGTQYAPRARAKFTKADGADQRVEFTEKKSPTSKPSPRVSPACKTLWSSNDGHGRTRFNRDTDSTCKLNTFRKTNLNVGKNKKRSPLARAVGTLTKTYSFIGHEDRFNHTNVDSTIMSEMQTEFNEDKFTRSYHEKRIKTKLESQYLLDDYELDTYEELGSLFTEMQDSSSSNVFHDEAHAAEVSESQIFSDISMTSSSSQVSSEASSSREALPRKRITPTLSAGTQTIFAVHKYFSNGTCCNETYGGRTLEGQNTNSSGGEDLKHRRRVKIRSRLWRHRRTHLVESSRPETGEVVSLRPLVATCFTQTEVSAGKVTDVPFARNECHGFSNIRDLMAKCVHSSSFRCYVQNIVDERMTTKLKNVGVDKQGERNDSTSAVGAIKTGALRGNAVTSKCSLRCVSAENDYDMPTPVCNVSDENIDDDIEVMTAQIEKASQTTSMHGLVFGVSGAPKRLHELKSRKHPDETDRAAEKSLERTVTRKQEEAGRQMIEPEKEKILSLVKHKSASPLWVRSLSKRKESANLKSSSSAVIPLSDSAGRFTGKLLTRSKFRRLLASASQTNTANKVVTVQIGSELEASRNETDTSQKPGIPISESGRSPQEMSVHLVTKTDTETQYDPELVSANKNVSDKSIEVDENLEVDDNLEVAPKKSCSASNSSASSGSLSGTSVDYGRLKNVLSTETKMLWKSLTRLEKNSDHCKTCRLQYISMLSPTIKPGERPCKDCREAQRNATKAGGENKDAKTKKRTSWRYWPESGVNNTTARQQNQNDMSSNDKAMKRKASPPDMQQKSEHCYKPSKDGDKVSPHRFRSFQTECSTRAEMSRKIRAGSVRGRHLARMVNLFEKGSGFHQDDQKFDSFSSDALCIERQQRLLEVRDFNGKISVSENDASTKLAMPYTVSADSAAHIECSAMNSSSMAVQDEGNKDAIGRKGCNKNCFEASGWDKVNPPQTQYKKESHHDTVPVGGCSENREVDSVAPNQISPDKVKAEPGSEQGTPTRKSCDSADVWIERLVNILHEMHQAFPHTANQGPPSLNPACCPTIAQLSGIPMPPTQVNQATAEADNPQKPAFDFPVAGGMSLASYVQGAHLMRTAYKTPQGLSRLNETKDNGVSSTDTVQKLISSNTQTDDLVATSDDSLGTTMKSSQFQCADRMTGDKKVTLENHLAEKGYGRARNFYVDTNGPSNRSSTQADVQSCSLVDSMVRDLIGEHNQDGRDGCEEQTNPTPNVFRQMGDQYINICGNRASDIHQVVSHQDASTLHGVEWAQSAKINSKISSPLKCFESQNQQTLQLFKSDTVYAQDNFATSSKSTVSSRLYELDANRGVPALKTNPRANMDEDSETDRSFQTFCATSDLMDTAWRVPSSLSVATDHHMKEDIIFSSSRGGMKNVPSRVQRFHMTDFKLTRVPVSTRKFRLRKSQSMAELGRITHLNKSFNAPLSSDDARECTARNKCPAMSAARSIVCDEMTKTGTGHPEGQIFGGKSSKEENRKPPRSWHGSVLGESSEKMSVWSKEKSLQCILGRLFSPVRAVFVNNNFCRGRSGPVTKSSVESRSDGKSKLSEDKSTAPNPSHESKSTSTHKSSENKSTTMNMVSESKSTATHMSSKNKSTNTKMSIESRGTATHLSSDNKSTATSLSCENKGTATNLTSENIMLVNKMFSESKSTATNLSSETKSTATNLSSESKSTATNLSSANKSTETNLSRENITAVNKIVSENKSTETDLLRESKSTVTNFKSESKSISTNLSNESVLALNQMFSVSKSTATNVSAESKSTATTLSSENIMAVKERRSENKSTETNKSSECKSTATNLSMDSKITEANLRIESKSTATNLSIESKSTATNLSIESKSTATNLSIESKSTLTNLSIDSKCTETNLRSESKSTTTDLNSEHNIAVKYLREERASDISGDDSPLRAHDKMDSDGSGPDLSGHDTNIRHELRLRPQRRHLNSSDNKRTLIWEKNASSKATTDITCQPPEISSDCEDVAQNLGETCAVRAYTFTSHVESAETEHPVSSNVQFRCSDHMDSVEHVYWTEAGDSTPQASSSHFTDQMYSDKSSVESLNRGNSPVTPPVDHSRKFATSNREMNKPPLRANTDCLGTSHLEIPVDIYTVPLWKPSSPESPQKKKKNKKKDDVAVRTVVISGPLSNFSIPVHRHVSTTGNSSSCGNIGPAEMPSSDRFNNQVKPLTDDHRASTGWMGTVRKILPFRKRSESTDKDSKKSGSAHLG